MHSDSALRQIASAKDAETRGEPLMRSQLELYIAEELGSDKLVETKRQTELRKVNKEISDLKKKLTALQTRKPEIEKTIGKGSRTRP